VGKGPSGRTAAAAIARYSCAGTLHGPVNDCSRRPTKALVCFGIIDPSGQVTSQDELETLAREPVPVIITACERHIQAIVDWAFELWGQIADAGVVPIAAVDDLRISLGLADRPMSAINPDPRSAVAVRLGSSSFPAPSAA
jgi:hypothetical protein